MNSRTLFELIGTADEQLLEQSEWTVQKRNRGTAKKVFLLIAAGIAALAVTVTAAAVSEGETILGWILSAASHTDVDGFVNQDHIQEQISHGEWIYLNGDSIAVIVPESPVKIMLSHDKGVTWKESFVQGSEEMEIYGDFRRDFPYYGGYIGFFGDGGYLVLTAGVSMNDQPMRIYLTGDGGNTWSEIGNPYKRHASVLTGAGFSCAEIGFVSYRYYEDAGPDIWWTRDGGDTWEKLTVEIPEQYSNQEYRFTPGTPTFDGPNGIYPITYYNHTAPNPTERTIYMHTSDYGLTWTFD